MRQTRVLRPGRVVSLSLRGKILLLCVFGRGEIYCDVDVMEKISSSCRFVGEETVRVCM